MRFSNVQVVTRTVDPIDRERNTLPVSKATIKSLDGVSLSVHREGADAISTHEYDAVIGKDEGLPRTSVTRLLRQLLHGVGVGIFGFGAEKIGEHRKMICSVLDILESLIQSQGKDLNVSLSFGIFGINDSSCVDLTTFERFDTEAIEDLVKSWARLTPIKSIQSVKKSIENYALPVVILIRLFVKPLDSSLPSSMATLTIADLGPMMSTSVLDRSLSSWRSAVLTMDQARVAGRPRIALNHLMPFMEEHFGGDSECLVLLNIPASGGERAIISQLQIVDAVRRIKNRPLAKLETREMIELSVLVEAHSKLEEEHSELRHQLSCLQKQLKFAGREKDRLLQEMSQISTDKEIELCEFDYAITALDMERIVMAEKARQCEINLVVVDHERLILRSDMWACQVELERLENLLLIANRQREEAEEQSRETINILSEKLTDATGTLLAMERDKSSLLEDVKCSVLRVTELEKTIATMETQQSILVSNHSKTSAEENYRLETLKNELDTAKSAETILYEKIKTLESEKRKHETTVLEVENQMKELRIENATLQAKLQVLSTAKPQSPQVSRTIDLMELKWQSEKEALYSMMNDLRSLVKERKPMEYHQIPVYPMYAPPQIASPPIVNLQTSGPSGDIGAPIVVPPAEKISRLDLALAQQKPRESTRKPITVQKRIKPTESHAGNNKGLTKRITIANKRDTKMSLEDDDYNPQTDDSVNSFEPIENIITNNHTINSQRTGIMSTGSRSRKNSISKNVHFDDTNDILDYDPGMDLVIPQASFSLSKNFAGKKQESIKCTHLEEKAPITSKNTIKKTTSQKYTSESACNLTNASNSATITKDTVTSKSKPKAVVKTSKAFKENASVLSSRDAVLDNNYTDDVPMEDVAIPGTPPPASPAKVWKPSSFVPGLKKTTNSFSKTACSTLGMLNRDDDNSFRKRIKLPERIRPTTLPGVDVATVLGGSRRAIDQGTYSTIITAFDMPTESGSKS